jgi:hypothetical protein
MATNNPTVTTPIVSTKKIIIGILIMLGTSIPLSFIIKFVISLFQPSQFDWVIYLGIILPINLIIDIPIFTKYWNRSVRSITLLLLILAGKDLLIAFLVPFPFSWPILLLIGYFIIARWLNHEKYMINNPAITTPIVSKKKIIIGMFIMYGVGFSVSLVLYSTLSLFQQIPSVLDLYYSSLSTAIPFTLIIDVMIFTNYWNRSGISITLLLLILAGKDLLIAFLVPFPFSLSIVFVVDYFIIARWLNHEKYK